MSTSDHPFNRVVFIEVVSLCSIVSLAHSIMVFIERYLYKREDIHVNFQVGKISLIFEDKHFIWFIHVPLSSGNSEIFAT